MNDQIRRLSAKERAFKKIKEWIVNGALQPEEKLNETELAQIFGVSRTPIREALKLLNVQGFVEMHSRRSIQVAALYKEDIFKILPPLAVLHALAAELATPVIQQQTIDSLRHINTKFAQAVGEGKYYSILKLNEQFHKDMVDVAQNTYISNIISLLQAHARRLLIHNSIILTSDSVKEYEAILQAFECKDKGTASNIIRNHYLRPIEVYYSNSKNIQ